jgi:alkylhydroperoxidase/carboxymuconolactone decarboxylase family protein YurZ
MSHERSGDGEAPGGRDEVQERGMRTRREVLGDEHVDRAVAATTQFTAEFQDLITRYAFRIARDVIDELGAA